MHSLSATYVLISFTTTAVAAAAPIAVGDVACYGYLLPNFSVSCVVLCLCAYNAGCGGDGGNGGTQDVHVHVHV